MYRMLQTLARIIAAMLLLMVPWAFAYGPLFPWSAVRPGYQTLALARADIVYPKGSVIDPAYLRTDQILAEAELFHKLPAPRRVRIVACANWDDFFRFSPLTRGTGLAGTTLATGTAIFITPKIAERKLDTGEFLRHEISHAIVNQNMSLWRQLAFRHHTWLFEGVPVWFGHQRAYLSQDEFMARARTADLNPYFEFDANATHPPAIDMRFAYVAWRDFLDYLAQHGSMDMFQTFFGAVQREPANTRALFEHTYGQPLQDMVREFQTAIQANTYIPAE